MNEPLVSIITPCYNGESYVHRLFDSILSQSYNNIEFIFINDGSTDNTYSVFKQWKPLFESKGIKVIYIYQENAGQAAAINNALKFFSGDYLTWPDADDYYSQPTALADRVQFLESKIDCSVVYTNGLLLSENGRRLGCFKDEAYDYNNRDIFKDCLLEQSFWYCPIAYLFRSSSIRSSIKDMRIFESRGGQNWQLMLPVFYSYQTAFLDKIDFIYLVRSKSHSRYQYHQLNIEEQRRNEHKVIITSTIERMLISVVKKKEILPDL